MYNTFHTKLIMKKVICCIPALLMVFTFISCNLFPRNEPNMCGESIHDEKVYHLADLPYQPQSDYDGENMTLIFQYMYENICAQQSPIVKISGRLTGPYEKPISVKARVEWMYNGKQDMGIAITQLGDFLDFTGSKELNLVPAYENQGGYINVFVEFTFASEHYYYTDLEYFKSKFTEMEIIVDYHNWILL